MKEFAQSKIAVFLHFLYTTLEYHVSQTGFVLGVITLGKYTSVLVTNTISFGFGLALFLITRYIKKRDKRKYEPPQKGI